MSYAQIAAFTGTQDQAIGLIEWQAGSIAVLKHYQLDTISKGAHMQRQFTIEVRVDYADADKNAVMKETLQACARHAYATAVLLNDGVKAQVAIFSDDFFSGHEEIMLLDDTIQKGIDAVGGADEADKPSSEMLAAMRGE
jgi:hypothetical protein